MSSQDQNKKEASAKNGTSVTPILLILLFVSVIGAVVFFLREKIVSFAHRRSEESQNDTQSGSPLSPQTETVNNDAKPEEKTSDEKASESTVIENFVTPEEIPDNKMVR